MRKLDGETSDAVDSVLSRLGEMLSTEEEELTLRGSVGDVLDKVEDSLVCGPGKHVSGVEIHGHR